MKKDIEEALKIVLIALACPFGLLLLLKEKINNEKEKPS
jgi:hypothetical protein